MKSHDRFRKGRARPASATLFRFFSRNGGEPPQIGLTLLIGRRQYFSADREFFAEQLKNQAHTGGRAMVPVGQCRNSGDLK
jgi:hypothetical protein